MHKHMGKMKGKERGSGAVSTRNEQDMYMVCWYRRQNRMKKTSGTKKNAK